jgi:hypothetical protein
MIRSTHCVQPGYNNVKRLMEGTPFGVNVKHKPSSTVCYSGVVIFVSNENIACKDGSFNRRVTEIYADRQCNGDKTFVQWQKVRNLEEEIDGTIKEITTQSDKEETALSTEREVEEQNVAESI